MKTIQSIKNPEDMWRVPDKVAEKNVKTEEYRYIPKRLWKIQSRCTT